MRPLIVAMVVVGELVMDLRPGEWFVRARMIAEAGKSDGLQVCNTNRTNVRHVK
jgi:hypothetical protein